MKLNWNFLVGWEGGDCFPYSMYTVPPLCTIKFHVVESECHFYFLQRDNLLHVKVVILDIYKSSQLATQHLFYNKLLDSNLNFND